LRRRGSGRRRGAAAAALVLAATGVQACGDGDADAFVERDGSSLTVDGEPFHFVGLNLYDAAASDVYSCKPTTRLTDEELADTLRYAREEAGVTVLRFWAYQTYTNGGTDFSGIDRVLSAARAAGLRVVPVLEDGPGDCSTGEPGVPLDQLPGDDWYTDGYREPYGTADLSYRDYVRVVTEHYRDEPTILAWMMVNEAETRARDEQDRSALVGFAQDVGAVIRSVDDRHLLTLGTQANGAFGTSGRDVTDIYRLPVLDFAEVHDWGFYGSDTEALPGSQDGRLPDPESPACTALDASIACSFARVEALGKPLVVGEAGIRADDEASRRRRARLLAAKVEAAFDAGADGYIVWHLNKSLTDGYDLVPALDDPSFDVLKRAAARREP